MINSRLDALPLFEQTLAVPEPPNQKTALSFFDLVRDFSRFGQLSTEIWEGPIRYLVNEFWTSGQRQAHSIHEVSYRACFKPQLPEFFIERLTNPGDAIYDPFMGRGTTAIQAALMGRQPVGNDINPLSILLTRPRLSPPTLNAVARRLEQIKWDMGEIEEPELLAFYSPGTLRHVCALRRWLTEHAPLDGTSDPVDDWIRMVAINRLTGHSPGFFSVYTLPPNQAVSAQAERKINEQRGQTPPDRDVKRADPEEDEITPERRANGHPSCRAPDHRPCTIDAGDPHRFGSVGCYLATVSRYCSICRRQLAQELVCRH